MKTAPLALKTPFWINGFLYILAAHLSGYLAGELAFLLLPGDFVHLSYLFALGGCILSLPLFLRWFLRNETPVGYLAATAVSHLSVSISGSLILIPLIYLADALTTDPDKTGPWPFLAVWLSVAVFFGALLILLCMGLLIFALIRKKRKTAAEAAADPLPETTNDT